MIEASFDSNTTTKKELKLMLSGKTVKSVMSVCTQLAPIIAMVTAFMICQGHRDNREAKNSFFLGNDPWARDDVKRAERSHTPKFLNRDWRGNSNNNIGSAGTSVSNPMGQLRNSLPLWMERVILPLVPKLRSQDDLRSCLALKRIVIDLYSNANTTHAVHLAVGELFFEESAEYDPVKEFIQLTGGDISRFEAKAMLKKTGNQNVSEALELWKTRKREAIKTHLRQRESAITRNHETSFLSSRPAAKGNMPSIPSMYCDGRNQRGWGQATSGLTSTFSIPTATADAFAGLVDHNGRDLRLAGESTEPSRETKGTCSRGIESARDKGHITPASLSALEKQKKSHPISERKVEKNERRKKYEGVNHGAFDTEALASALSNVERRKVAPKDTMGRLLGLGTA